MRRVAFSDDGQALLSGGEESLKVWGWEPVRCFEQAEVRWSRLADLSVGPNQQLVAGSVREAVVAVWSIDLAAMKPFSTSASVAAPDAPASCCAAAETGPTASPARMSPARAARGGASAWSAPSPASCSQVHDNAGAREAGMAAPAAPPTQALTEPAPDAAPAVAATSGPRARPSDAADDGLTASCARMHIADCRARIAAARTQPRTSDVSSAPGADDGQRTEESQTREEAVLPKGSAVAIEHPRGTDLKSVGTSMGDSLASAPRAPAAPRASSETPVPINTPLTAIPATRQAPLGLDPSNFPQKRDAPQPGRAHADGTQPLAALLQEGRVQKAQLSERLASLRSLRALWATGDVRKVSCSTQLLPSRRVC